MNNNTRMMVAKLKEALKPLPKGTWQVEAVDGAVIMTVSAKTLGIKHPMMDDEVTEDDFYELGVVDFPDDLEDNPGAYPKFIGFKNAPKDWQEKMVTYLKEKDCSWMKRYFKYDEKEIGTQLDDLVQKLPFFRDARRRTKQDLLTQYYEMERSHNGSNLPDSDGVEWPAAEYIIKEEKYKSFLPVASLKEDIEALRALL